jgi:15-cis-phytoene synthase
MSGTITDAYAHCETITREQARNFYYGIRLLSPDRRAALCALYALARRIDDIGDDEDTPAAQRSIRLAEVRRSLAEPERSTDPVLVAVADAARRYPVPLGAFGELVDGVQLDIDGQHVATFEDLVVYCRCVAGSIGRLCLGVFGSRPHPDAAAYADALGIALQQTNILRDIREDHLNGRVYLPAEDLDKFGVRLELDAHGALVDEDGALSELIRHSARRAEGWYADGMRLVPLLEWRSAACCRAMSGIYRRLLAQIAARPDRVFARRLSLTGWQKATVAARALSGISS